MIRYTAREEMENSLANRPKFETESRQSGTASDSTAPVAEILPGAGFPIVGIGGSAGSLAAFQEILRHLPADSGLSVVIVSHQDPSVPSLLAEILAKATSLAVAQCSDGTALESGRVYVAPPGQYLGVHDGVLRHEGRIERLHTPLPIDFFFRSLARDQKQRAVGVVVSGSGADGALGLAAIRDLAGLTLAQDPQTAEFPGMPASAIASGTVDLVLPLEQIAARLLAHTRQAETVRTPAAPAPRAADSLERIIELVAEHTQQDFTEYKRGTIERRIERRLQLHQLGDLAAYARFLEENPGELSALARDWLIGVSGFFRDAEAFAALERALPKLIASRGDGVLRAWVPGCATGQEAYSIAILLLEAIERAQARVQLQIFATDIDPLAIDTARAARYPEGVAAEVEPKRLARFFTRADRSFVVNRRVREVIVFAVQNLLRDPPFTKLDLLSCRNLLIYFTTEAQKRILPLFHYSLNPDGLLLLGSSESVTGFDELFAAVDRHWKLFRGVESAAVRRIPIDWVNRTIVPSLTLPSSGPAAGLPRSFTPAELLRRHLADHYGPPSVLVDARGQVSQFHGRTGEFLELPAGQPNLNVLDMARSGLRGPLSAAMRAVSEGNQIVAECSARVRNNGGFVPVRVRVTRLSGSLPMPSLLIAFERGDEHAGPILEPPPEPARPASDRIGELEEVLRSTRDDLQSTIEALQAANEELASANEEVQSTNEELRTSKEETQSLNEELQTSNADLHAKVENLAQSNDDLTNLLAATGIAIVFLDEQLRVRRFTPAAQRLIPLVASDIGRPLADLAAPLGYPDLLEAARSVLETLAPSEREVRTDSGAWYSARISPYRTASNAIEGLAIAFVDTTRAKGAELREAALELERDLLEAVRDPFLVLDTALRVVRANGAFYRLFQVQPEKVEGGSVFELDSGAWDIPALRKLLERILPENRSFDGFEVENEFPRIGPRRLRLNARRVDRSPLGSGELILLAIEDTTEMPRKQVESDG
jgi:two-component system, chemotaxis family, CheB/CheR fusion protein